jgi:enoyl-CoA hydratase/carnithine racemase
MEFKFIRIDKEGPFTTIVLNRPEKRNAINLQMAEEIRDACYEIDEDNENRVIFLRGEGAMFSSGIDLSELGALMAQVGSGGTRRFRTIVARLQDCLNTLEAIERPVIAVLHNKAIGMATELALACDFRIAADNVQLGLLEPRLGMISDVGGTTRAVRTIGLTRAKELTMSGRILEAPEALQWGLICRMVPEDKLLDEARSFAEQFLPASPVAIGITKRILDRGMHLDKMTLMQLEALGQSIVLKSEDLMEAFSAYTGKREPKFKGK